MSNTIADRPVSVKELHKERLIAACIEDRRRLHLLFVPPPPPPVEEESYEPEPLGIVGDLLKFAGAIPGPIGRWSRRVALGTKIFSVFSSFARKSR